MSALFQFHHDGAGEPTLAGLAERYGVDITAFDRDYGVVLVDEQAGLWVALVDDDQADVLQASLSDEDRDRGTGVFSNPVIEPADGEPSEPDERGPAAWS